MWMNYSFTSQVEAQSTWPVLCGKFAYEEDICHQQSSRESLDELSELTDAQKLELFLSKETEFYASLLTIFVMADSKSR